jgi:hypothetical protein
VALTRRDSHNSWISFWGAFQPAPAIAVGINENARNAKGLVNELIVSFFAFI